MGFSCRQRLRTYYTVGSFWRSAPPRQSFSYRILKRGECWDEPFIWDFRPWGCALNRCAAYQRRCTDGIALTDCDANGRFRVFAFDPKRTSMPIDTLLARRRQAFKGWHAVCNEMERLTFRCEDRLLRAAID